eukprot:3612060-Prymnesium_polylepis.1
MLGCVHMRQARRGGDGCTAGGGRRGRVVGGGRPAGGRAGGSAWRGARDTGRRGQGAHARAAAATEARLTRRASGAEPRELPGSARDSGTTAKGPAYRQLRLGLTAGYSAAHVGLIGTEHGHGGE